jgi:hypothetical protein
MADPLVKARGYFWWADEVIPEGCFAPPTMVTGELEISSVGRIALRLDSTLGKAAERLFNRRPTERPITGIFIGRHEYVRLSGLIPNGGNFSSGGSSTKGFIARFCLISSQPFSHARRQLS